MPPGEIVEWGVAARPLSGELVSGDPYLVKSFLGGVLVAVVDGLGHGPVAAIAARQAIDSLDQHAEEPPEALLKHCDHALQGTRGAILSLASFHSSGSEMTRLGLGNVESTLIPAAPNGTSVRESLSHVGGPS